VTKVVMEVPAIDCAHCAQAITGALQPQEGVASVRVDVPAQQVHLELDEQTLSVDRVKEILAAEDYEVEAVTTA
jgi:copper chaperone CopZ